MTLDLEAAQESVDGLRKVAAAFDRKNMPAGAKANRVLADQTQALVDEVRKQRQIVGQVEAIVVNIEGMAGMVPGIIARQIRTALVAQCHHDDGAVECWHFGERDGRDG